MSEVWHIYRSAIVLHISQSKVYQLQITIITITITIIISYYRL